ncbi:AlpA family phage regulatory protein [Streptomyces sp. NPDC007914]|uniref:helix-turn-helix transcriptional regulator n=1 Tax=Streptomyces sp. NPDC007914 TaxID=3364791 RepID=UPI0036E2F082
MPKSPESEGSRLITLKEIEQEHGVSRSSLHTYRRSASFPQPVSVEGSTKIQYDAREVAAWFEAHPPSQGKRTDLAPRDEGAAVPQTEQTSRSQVGKPDYLTDEQWTGLAFSIIEGVGKGLHAAGLRVEWAASLGPLALEAVRPRLDELVESEVSDG